MSQELSTEIYKSKESLRDRIAEETLHWWRQNGVLNVSVDYYPVTHWMPLPEAPDKEET